MKKIIKVFTILISLFMLMFTLTSCDIEGLLNQYLPGVDLPFGDKTKEPTNNPTYGNSCEDGNHNFGDYYQNNETHHYLTCQDCGEYKYESHEFTDWTIIEEPTEHSIGLKMRTCNICKWDEKVDIPMLDKEDTPTDSVISDCYGFRMHYYRPDGNYDGWNLWVWKDGFDGNSYYVNGNQDDNGITFILKWEDLGIYDYKNTMIGFIVRKGEWELKDVEADRFIDFSYHTPNSDGYMDFYLLSKEHEIFFEPVDNKPVQEIFIEDMYLLNKYNDWKFSDYRKFEYDKSLDRAFIELTLKEGDKFIVSSYDKKIIFDYRSIGLCSYLVNSEKADHSLEAFAVECLKEGFYRIIIDNFSNTATRTCYTELVENIVDEKCTVEEALKLPLGTKVKIEGYIRESGNYYYLEDLTGSILLYDITGHVHDNLYGTVEGVLYDYNGTIELYPCTFTNLDSSQFSNIRLGNIIKDNNQLYDGLKVTLGTTDLLIGCKYKKYYNTTDFQYTGSIINVCTEVFTLVAENGNWLLQATDGSYLQSEDKNMLSTTMNLNEYSRWNININDSGEASISNTCFPNYFIKFNTTSIHKNVSTGMALGSTVYPYLYTVEVYEDKTPSYDELYLRGSFNGWNIDDNYSLRYNPIDSSYFISAYLKNGDEFKIANADWSYQFNFNNTILNFESLGAEIGSDNIILPYEGTYSIHISNYQKENETCEIIYMPDMKDIFLTSASDNYEISYMNKFYGSYNKYNLVYDVIINEGSLYLYSIESLYGYNYFDKLGYIIDAIAINDKLIDFKEAGNYRIIIENYNDYENSKLHILKNNEKISISEALNYPDSAIVILEGEFKIEDKKMYLYDETGKMLLYNYTHVHSSDKGLILGEITTYVGEKEIINGNITITETIYDNETYVDTLVENTDQLYDGMKVVIAYENYFMTCQSTNHRKTCWYEDIYGKLNECIGIFTLVKVDSYWKIQDITGEYLYINDGTSNALYTGTVNDGSDLWNIVIENGVASIQNVLYTERYIQINSTKLDRFTSYRNNQSNPSIYIIKNEEVDFSTLNMICLGDSITYGYEPYTGKKMQNPYPELVKELLGLNSISNYGISGDTVGYAPDRKIMANRYIEMKDNADIISVLGGINDYRYGIIPLGNIDDNTINTIYGAYNVLAQGLKEKYPNSFIFFMTPYKWAGDKGVCSQGYTLEDMSNAIKEVCAKYDIPVLDLYSNGNLESEFNLSASDGLHPTQEFLIKCTAPQIAEFIKNSYAK